MLYHPGFKDSLHTTHGLFMSQDTPPSVETVQFHMHTLAFRRMLYAIS